MSSGSIVERGVLVPSRNAQTAWMTSSGQASESLSINKQAWSLWPGSVVKLELFYAVPMHVCRHACKLLQPGWQLEFFQMRR